MRISNSMLYDRAIENMSSQLERLSQQRDRVASAKAFDQASDNPIAASQALSLKSTLQASQGHLDTAHAADDWMSANEIAFKNVNDLAKRALELGTGALSETNSASERLGVAKEIQGILDELVNTANSSSQGSYLFGGFAVTQPPFEIKNGNVIYHGDSGAIQRDLGGFNITINADGQGIFQPLLKSLQDLSTALQNNQTPGIDSALGSLMSATENATQARTINGTHQRQTQLAITNLEQTQVELKKMVSDHEDLNMVDALSRLKQEENAFQTVLEVEQRTISAMNLFDVLR